MQKFSVQAVGDFRTLRRGNPAQWNRTPRHRRRLAVRIGWHTVQRLPRESWVDFWRAELASRQA